MRVGTEQNSFEARVDVAVRGVRWDAPVQRSKGAGPSDDGHLVVDGANAALPLDPDSPYTVREGRVYDGRIDLGLTVEPVARPNFYDLKTADGVPYRQIALLHGRDVLATTVVQTCIRYAEDQRCRFCTIEESLRAGSTIAAKTPAQLAEVAEAAVRLDGVRQMVMTTGTTAGPDRGARHLVRCVRGVLEAVPGLPIQVQIEPPGDLAVLTELHQAGAVSVGIHVESLDDEVRRRWMPGKSTVPMTEYEAAWDEAVRVFGRNRVSTYLLIGLGEDPDELVAGAGRLIQRGVYPFVVPMRPMLGTLARRDGAKAPSVTVVKDVTERVAALLRAAGMTGADQVAGCAACGACGALSAAGA
ncbi:MSMEG_0568 family radical SAM protein [Amycolatopsis acidiphila]|uniref:MSMEG_0568 family radical SAM protein n=1 Tax=Amycolatopsis acidiphila TaxID=715473 RepID=A0A558ANZ0_9PSEU|nr:MSMEG_0568 family radical SAM protein [Amycolatopsis acidiphila]TVT25971.1 MSMEG_0568 family radical SAM protein [Amycolatopsis acidiphila]UIJ63316.1 MSMEG_0568 family radical SAM protein [Amycolatopsis acidiphila]GHG74983.1 radical SAM protein [Amycolatopsis acidiphila]